MTERTWVGASYERGDGYDKARGLAVYGTDVALPGMLHAKVLRSPLPHARILHVDVDRARRLRGVKAVVAGRDLPDSHWGMMLADQPVYAVDRVRYVGEAVAGVAAADEDAAQEALDLIRVEYEELPPLFDPEEAMAPGAPLLHPDLEHYACNRKFFFPVPGTNICNYFRLRRGDVEEGFRSSDLVFEDTFEIPMVQHCPLEPHACVAHLSPQGKLTIWSNTQGAYLTREQVARGLKLPQSDVRIVCTYVGGAFGGKISGVVEVLAGALALRTDHRPVRLGLTREEEFVSTFVRQPAKVTYKTGVRRNGDFLARQVRLLWDTGAYGDYEVLVCRNAGYSSAGPYRIPHVRIDSYCVYTNKPVAGAYRGFGVPETCFGYEGQLDRIAREIGMDPVELRLRNGVETGDLTPTGQTLEAVGLKECLRRAAEALGGKRGAPSPGKRRGRGVAWMSKFTVTGAHVQSVIKTNEDGSAVLLTSAVEHGQGAHTVLRQIAGEALGLDPRLISVGHPDTAMTPYGWETSASKTTFFDGNAVRRAAEDAKRQLFQAAAVVLEAAPEDLEARDGRIFPRSAPERSVPFNEVSMGAVGPDGRVVGGPVLGRGHYTPVDGTLLDPETGQGRKPAVFWMFAAQGAEVEVDEETGAVRVLKLTAAHDVGKAINPDGCTGQIEGALGQGLGIALFEEMPLERGVVLNPNLLDYKIPCPLDMPPLVPMIVEEPHPEGPYGAKGVGEPGLAPTAAAIANAVYDAIGVQIKTHPFTPERVLQALRGRTSG
ncbi:MAG: xanthine dehydrogenase family protein [Candidatus Tectomicrobia bacterium]|nr:xanthine dehydrogenase family protein [Candidatus Tectomicrobia bacterium]